MSRLRSGDEGGVMWRMIAGALLLPASVFVYFLGAMVLFPARLSAGWLPLAFGWAFLTLGGGVLGAVRLMTRDL